MASPATSRRNRLVQLFKEFLRLEAAGGLCLMAATVLAMAVANSPLVSYYTAFLNLKFEVRLGSFGIGKPLLLWINDGLMAVFFLVVGLELKREVLEGHLSSVRKATLPAIAAVGGMLGPAALYALFNRGNPAALRGWAIPTATDIAFALGVLSLVGKRVPAALKAFLLSIAVFDDLGAIIIIAVFYTAGLSVVSLFIAVALLLVLVCLNRFGVSKPGPYLVVGAAMWVAVLKSGVHATLAGVVLAMCIPLRGRQKAGAPGGSDSLLLHIEHALHPWVAFGVLPIFAFANGGVRLFGLSVADILHPVPLGISIGLFIGKQAGILGTCWIAVRAGIASPPQGIGWRKLHGATLLCGIGFTMSLFIASLAFEQDGDAYQGLERLGILLGTLISGIVGYIVLRAALSPVARAE